MVWNKKYSEEVDRICKLFRIDNYIRNEDGSIDVMGDVIITGWTKPWLPLVFNNVYGNFYCRRMELTSLKGAPRKVSGVFNCHDNDLRSLEYAPEFVGGYVTCTKNYLDHNKENIDILLRYDSVTLDEDIKTVLDRYRTINNIVNN